MKKCNYSLIDLKNYTISTQLSGNKYTTVNICQKNISPWKRYIFRTFHFNCINPNMQKIVLQTFYQINSQKNQYLQSYKGFSFISFQSTLHPTFSMKYISSTTLDKVIREPNFRSNWTFSDVMRCLFAVAEGLSYLHGRLVYHGNLCPSNIVIDSAKQCYLCDFGLYPIKIYYYENNDVANYDYKDPKMINSEPNKKNDIYSFGVLMCHFCLIFYGPGGTVPLRDFIRNPNKNKYKTFPPIFSELIPKCLSSSSSLVVDDIIGTFRDPKYMIGNQKVSDLYQEFIKVNYVATLAEQGDPFALNKLGEMYEKGTVVPKDHQKALIYYERAAVMCNSEAQANFGVLLQEDADKSEEKMVRGARFLEDSAKQGNIHGMANYGIALKKGEGVKKDIVLAEEYLRRSANLGYSYAQVNYGYTLLEVNPTLQRINEGLHYIKLAMNQGDADAYYTYGILLMNGDFVAKDDAAAMSYFKVSADMGYESAILEYAKGCEEGIGMPKNRKEALEYYQMAYEKGVEEVKNKIDLLSKYVKNKTKRKSSETTPKKQSFYNEDYSPTIGPIRPVVKDKPSSNPTEAAATTTKTEQTTKSSSKSPKVFEISSSSSDNENENEKDVSVVVSGKKHPKVKLVFKSSSSSSDQSPNINDILSSSSSSSTQSSTFHTPNMTPIEISSSSSTQSSSFQTPTTNMAVISSPSNKAASNPADAATVGSPRLSRTVSTQNQMRNILETPKAKDKTSSLSHAITSQQNKLPSQASSRASNNDDSSHGLSATITSKSLNKEKRRNTVVSVKSSSSSSSNQSPTNSQATTSISIAPKLPQANSSLQPSVVSVTPTKRFKPPAATSSASKMVSVLPSSFEQPAPFNEHTPSNELLSIFREFKEQYNKQSSEAKSKTKFPLYIYEDQFIRTNNSQIIYEYARLYDNDTKTKANKAKAYRYYKLAADLGDARSQAIYGTALQNGKDVKKNLKEGFKYLEKAAAQKNLNGMSNYGLALINGEGTKKNKSKGLEILKEAADKGDPFGQLNYGLSCENLIEGHNYVEKAVNANYKKAYLYYATDLMDGRGVPQDLPRAAQILQDLYDLEHKKKVLINLIECLKPINYNKALEYMKILADSEDENVISHIYKARFLYGLELYNGEHISKDLKLAVHYLSRSNHTAMIRSKYPDIFILIPHDYSSVKANVSTFLRRNGLIDPEEERIIREAYKGNPDDNLAAAKMIEKTGDYKTANFFYEIAADSNQREAAFILGMNYMEGKNGLNINKTKGEKYINKSADLGYPDARCEVIKYSIKAHKMSNKNNSLYDDIFNDLNELASDNFVPAIILKAKLFIILARYKEAKDEVQKALQLAPNDSKVLYKAAKILLKISENDEFGYDLIKRCSNDEPKASYFLGKYFFNKKNESPENLEKAAEYLTRAASLKIKDSQRLLNACKMELEHKRRAQMQKQTENKAQTKETPSKSEPKRKSKPKQTTQSQQALNIVQSAIQKLQLMQPNPQPQQLNQSQNQNQKQLQKQKQNKNQNQKQSQNQLQNQKDLAQKDELDKNSEEDQDEEGESNPEHFIDLDLPSEELIKLGDSFNEKGIKQDAFQCYEAVAKRGEVIGYFKCAGVAPKLEVRLQYYEFAILNHFPGAFTGWRTVIFNNMRHRSQEKDKELFLNFAKRLEKYGDFSDAAVVYKRIKDQLNFELCYEKAKSNIQNIQDKDQQFEFAKLLEKQNDTELAFALFKKAAENGVEDAQKKIDDLSKIKMNKIKRLNQVDSLLEQGICYFEGKNGTKIDVNKAFQFFTKASDTRNSPKADFYIGLYYKKGFGDMQTNQVNCAKFFKKSADAGDPDGQIGYGDCLKYGIGVGQNTDEAIHYYKLAADQDNENGEFHYGWELYSKNGNEQEKKEAIAYLKKSAEKLFPDGMYAYSKTIKQTNPDEAKKLFDLSIEKGSEMAIKEYGKELKEDGKFIQAAELYKSAADKGLLIGYRKYAKLIIKGYALRGDEDDDDIARNYYKKAADFGEAKDQFEYAEFLSQFFNDESAEERADLYKKASEQGYVKAFFGYAECLTNGDGVEKNTDEARKFYTLSYQKDPNSLTRLVLPRLKDQNLIDF